MQLNVPGMKQTMQAVCDSKGDRIMTERRDMQVFKKKNFMHYIRKDSNLYLMLLPGIVGFLIFQYIPIINNIFIGFVEYDLMKGVWGSKFVGLKYFIQFFEDPFFGRLLKNTVFLGLFSLLWGFPAPILLALLLNEIKGSWFKRITQSVSYLPYFISTVVIVGITYTIFGSYGVINTILQTTGLKAVSFIGNSAWFRTLYIGTGIWQGIGWSSIIYLAAMSGINHEIYEAAIIDGANRFRQAFHVTLPGILPSITILFILAIGNIINIGFEKVYLMYSPDIYDVADVIQTYVFRRGIEGMDFSYGGAVSFFNTTISLILIFITNYICKKISETSLF
jgi:putative aldouronate transport system permease protein